MAAPETLRLCCGRCLSTYLQLSQARWWEAPLKWWTVWRPYHCENCDWRGWLNRNRQQSIATLLIYVDEDDQQTQKALGDLVASTYAGGKTVRLLTAFQHRTDAHYARAVRRIP